MVVSAKRKSWCLSVDKRRASKPPTIFPGLAAVAYMAGIITTRNIKFATSIFIHFVLGVC